MLIFQRDAVSYLWTGCLLASMVLLATGCQSEPTAWRPQEMDLSGAGWKLWLDADAKWQTETLYHPDTPISQIPATQPSGSDGWQTLDKVKTVEVSVPGTVEEYLWDRLGPDKVFGADGNYQGVSFWWREFELPKHWKGRKIVLRFAAARQRSEVYVNDQLVGYDLVGNTPFSADATRTVRYDRPNRLAIRITDPNNNDAYTHFQFADWLPIPWGNTGVPASHGFGGITGPVRLQALPLLHVEDIFVKNKPSPSESQPTDVDVDVQVINDTGREQVGRLTLRIREVGESGAVVWQRHWDNVVFPVGSSEHSQPVSVPQARLWDLNHPNLYQCQAVVSAPGIEADDQQATFGFRWFGPDQLGTNNALLRLNGKRIVIRSAISWGHWPINGISPTPELARKQTDIAKQLGLNALSMHRTIGDQQLIEQASRMGLLLYCEPGGYKAEGTDDPLIRALAREKLLRMIKRDRNQPSVFAWGMLNELWVRIRKVYPQYLVDIVDAHRLDPTRIIALASGQNYKGTPEPGTSWLKPYDMNRLETGWFNEHHAGSPGVWVDSKYSNPAQYYLSNGPDGWILYWGEDGAISAPPQLDKLTAYIHKVGRRGWDGDEYLRWHKAYADWLDAHQAREVFPTVDDLCLALGNLAYYYQGRIIELARMTNRTDGYCINGWECSKLDNHSGIVDVLRNPKGDTSILARYNQPLYVAVRPRRMHAEPGGSTIVDFYLINEKNVRGPHSLRITAIDPTGRELMSRIQPVDIEGGDRYGQLLLRDVNIPAGLFHGKLNIQAQLLDSQEQLVADGQDQVMVVDATSQTLPSNLAVLDQSNLLLRFVKERKSIAHPYADTLGPMPMILVGTVDPATSPHTKGILDRVANDGTTLVVLTNAEKWAKLLEERKAVKFQGVMSLGGSWQGGSYFALKSPLLDGLPQAQVLNWEYQMLQVLGRKRQALVLTGDQAVIGAFNHHEPRLATGVGIIPLGKGKVILSAIQLHDFLFNNDPGAAVPKRVVINFILHGYPADWDQLHPSTQPR